MKQLPGQAEPSLLRVYADGLTLTRRMVAFWQQSRGWAPEEAADLIAKSRLDRQVALTESLHRWLGEDPKGEGDLILAWVNLGTLAEGAMKLLLCVYLRDYLAGNHKKNGKGVIKLPDGMSFEDLRQVIVSISHENDAHLEFLTKLQKRRNAIHAFEDKEIGNWPEFRQMVREYFAFLRGLHHRMPYPIGFKPDTPATL